MKSVTLCSFYHRNTHTICFYRFFLLLVVDVHDSGIAIGLLGVCAVWNRNPNSRKCNSSLVPTLQTTTLYILFPFSRCIHFISIIPCHNNSECSTVRALNSKLIRDACAETSFNRCEFVCTVISRTQCKRSKKNNRIAAPSGPIRHRICLCVCLRAFLCGSAMLLILKQFH